VVTYSSSLNHKFKFQGQEHQDELGLNWDSFKWRNYDYAIGRFMSIDPLSEKYSYQSTYAFAENKVISHIELEGLEGLHHTKVDKAGNRSHILEKNVIVLTKMTSPKYSDEKNARIKNDNQNRVDSIKSELKQSYAGAKNTSGESVEFKFNVIGMEVANPNTLGDDRRKVATEYGLEGKPAFEGGSNLIAPAVIISAQQTGQSKTKLFEVELSQNSDVGHEVGHEFLKGGQKEEENPPGTGGLMDDPPGRVLPFEVDKMLRDSIEANK
jgi:RHS repeat-associated protein